MMATAAAEAPPDIDAWMMTWRRDVVNGWTEAPAYALTYNVDPAHVCAEGALRRARNEPDALDTILTPWPGVLFGCMGCGRTHVCAAAGAPKAWCDPCHIVVNGESGCMTCVFSKHVVDDRLAYVAAAGFDEAGDLRRRLVTTGHEGTSVQHANANVYEAKAKVRQSERRADMGARAKAHDNLNTAVDLRRVEAMVAAAATMTPRPSSPPPVPVLHDIVLTHTDRDDTTYGDGLVTTQWAPLPARDADFWDAVFFPRVLGAAQWARLVKKRLDLAVSPPATAVAAERGHEDHRSTLARQSKRMHRTSAYDAPVPELRPGWCQQLAFLISGLLLHVAGPHPPLRWAVRADDVLYVWRRVVRWCELLAMTSPGLVRESLPAGHALAAYVLLLAPRRWVTALGCGADGGGWVIMPPDVIVTAPGNDMGRWIGAFFADPSVWIKAPGRRPRKPGRGQKRGRNDDDDDKDDDDAVDDLRRAVVAAAASSAPAAATGPGRGGGGGGGGMAGAHTPYDRNEHVTRLQIMAVAEKLEQAFTRCLYAPAWLHAFFNKCA